MKVVLDSSCIIILSQIEKMDILKMLFSEIFVSEAVFKEFMVKAPGTEGVCQIFGGWNPP